MMKFIVAFLAVASLAAVANAQRDAGASRPVVLTFASCTLSGDPHWVTFDGALHDYQGEGVFQAAKSKYVNIQYQTMRCNLGASVPVTCVRRVWIEVRNDDTGAAPSLCTADIWNNVFGNVVCDGNSTAFNQFTTRTLSNGLATVTKSGNNLVFNAVNKYWQVTYGQYYLSIQFPFFDGYSAVSRGTCGLFDGDATNEFTAFNGTKCENSAKGVRTNNAKVNACFFTYAVNASGNIPPLGTQFHHWDYQTNTHILSENVPQATNPTPEEQDALDKVTFANLDAYNAAADNCNKFSNTGLQVAIENCIYDAAVLGDYTLAATNDAALKVDQDARETSSDGLSAGAVAGIVLGCVAAVSLLTAMVMYVRLRKLRTEYSRALIVRSQAQDNNAPAGTLAENL